MRSQSQHFALRARPEDVQRLKQIRDEMQAQHQHATVTLADAFAFAVSSAAVAAGAMPNGERPMRGSG